MIHSKKKILIAHPDHALHSKIKRAKGSSQYHFESAYTGFGCLEKIETFVPDLILLELMLPQVHGMEILRKIKHDPRTKEMGIILSAYCALIQDYRSALINEADYFLEHPFEMPHLFELFKLFFDGELEPDPFTGKTSRAEIAKNPYQPKTHPPASYIRFWGTRGSNPVSGPEYVRFGGNTSCLEIRHGQDLVIIDAGTGIRPIGNLISENPPKEIHLVFSHTHLDHLSGFPFFGPIYNPGCHIYVWTPIGYEKTAREIFTEMLTYALFPVRLDDIQSTVTFKEIHEGVPFNVGHLEINSHYAFHPGATLCFKIGCHKVKFGYVTDNEFLMGYHGHPNQLKRKSPLLTPYDSQIRFFQDCDFMIHEAQYSPEEYQAKVGWGHSSISNAALLMKFAEVHDWVITHHDPRHTDLSLFKKIQLQNDILEEMHMKCQIRMAYDGFTIPL